MQHPRCSYLVSSLGCDGGTAGYRYANISREKTRNAFMLVYDRLDVDQQNK